MPGPVAGSIIPGGKVKGRCVHERTDLTFTSLYGLSQSLAALRTHDLKEGMGITVLTTVNADGAFADRPANGTEVSLAVRGRTDPDPDPDPDTARTPGCHPLQQLKD